MGKLMIKSLGNELNEVALKLGDMTIGRSKACDIVLKNDLSVSGKHAVIKTVGRKSSIEDLGSTNGTYVENKRIKRHELKHGETIIIGKYELRYRDVVDLGAPAFGARKDKHVTSEITQEKTRVITAHAELLALKGQDTGKRIPLVKEEIVLDNPGKNPARIYRTVEGYVLHAHVGPGEPRLNGKPVQGGGQLLENGDLIEIAGTKYQLIL